jgi:hypothetical protein
MPCFSAFRADLALPSSVFGPRDFRAVLAARFGTRIAHGNGRAYRGANTGHGGDPRLTVSAEGRR